MRKWLIVLLAVISTSAWGTTYYIDWVNGADTNDGTTKSTPWKRAPGMNGCVSGMGCYTYQQTHDAQGTSGAGDQFIFKGGVTWPNDALAWDWYFGNGTPGNPIYFGAGDKTWYTGISWTRPKLDAQLMAITPSIYSSAMLRTYGNWFVIDNFEFTGFTQLTGEKGCSNAGQVIFATGDFYDEAKAEVMNNYFHGWANGGDATGDCVYAIQSTAMNNPELDLKIHNNIIDGGDSKTIITMTIADPVVITSKGHGYPDGTEITIHTTGALPTFNVVQSSYFTCHIDGDAFTIYDTPAHAQAGGSTGRISSTGSQSGIHYLIHESHMAGAYHGSAGHFYNNYIANMTNGVVSSNIGYLWGNTLKNIGTTTYKRKFCGAAGTLNATPLWSDGCTPGGAWYGVSYDGSAHMNSLYTTAQAIIYNNYMNTVGGGVDIWIGPYIGNAYAFNNVAVYDGSQGIQVSNFESGQEGNKVYVFNNTLHGIYGARISPPSFGDPYLDLGELMARNNLMIGDVTSIGQGSHLVMLTSSNNLGWTESEATSAGYIMGSTYPFDPPNGSAATVDAGYDLTSLCAGIPSNGPSLASTACLSGTTAGVSYDSINHRVIGPTITAVVRGTAWDIGAYQYVPVQIRNTESGLRNPSTSLQLISPNPIKAVLFKQYLQLNSNKRVYDLTGNLINKSQYGEPGIYLVKEGKAFQKVVVIK
jgi:hypothetical protein